MFPASSRPRENGRQTPPYPQSPSTQAQAERNIRASSGWLWQERSTLERINQSFSGSRLLAARSVYLALTECASQQHTPTRAHTSCAYLGRLAGMKEAAVRRYIHDFAAIGLIEVLPGVHQANTYILLGDASAVVLAVASMPLADGAGRSQAIASSVGTHSTVGIGADQQVSKSALRRAMRGIPGDRHVTATVPSGGKSGPAGGSGGDPLTHEIAGAGQSAAMANGSAGDPPHQAAASVRGIPADRQIVRIKDSKNQNKQTNRVGGDELADGTPHHGLAKADTRPLILSDEQQQAINSLTGIGVRRVLAEELASDHDAANIRAWVRYALRTNGLKSKAGFVLSRLRAGEQPPTGAIEYHSSGNHQLAPSWGLIEASVAEQLSAEQTEVNTLPQPSPTEQAIWHAAKEELLLEVKGGAKLWLQHMRLVGVEADRLILSSPPVGGTTNADLYTERIAELLSAMLGRTMQVEFQGGW